MPLLTLLGTVSSSQQVFLTSVRNRSCSRQPARALLCNVSCLFLSLWLRGMRRRRRRCGLWMRGREGVCRGWGSHVCLGVASRSLLRIVTGRTSPLECDHVVIATCSRRVMPCHFHPLQTTPSAEEPPGSISIENEARCGWCFLRPKFLQRFRTAKWALFSLCWAGALQGESFRF